MLSVGKNIASSADALAKMPVDYLYHSLRNPKPEISARVRQLRIVRHLDEKQYGLLKRTLPYVVCGMFNPPYRSINNFAYTEYFIVDIDHLSDKGLDTEVIRKQIEKDERTVLCFLSPGEDGLKVLFKLKERCYDAGVYTLFYKAFVRKFSVEYSLEQVVDSRTSDVSRACFISIDTNAYYNDNATLVDVNAYLEMGDSTSMMDLKSSFINEEKELKKAEKQEAGSNINDPDAEVLARIKGVLNPKGKNANAEKIPVYVPERLNEMMDDLKVYLENTGVVLYEQINIQYGKKLRMKLGARLAEINLFYGKRGFSVVQSPRGGTSAEFNQLMSDLINAYLCEVT